MGQKQAMLPAIPQSRAPREQGEQKHAVTMQTRCNLFWATSGAAKEEC